MAFEDGTTAPEIMLLPYNKDPATGSRIPSISTGGAARKAVMKHVVAASKVGNMMVPNQPMYRRFSVLVIQFEKRSQVEASSPRFSMSTGERVLALNLDSRISTSLEISWGTNLRGVVVPVRWLVEATLGIVKASEVDTRSVRTRERENFMLLANLILFSFCTSLLAQIVSVCGQPFFRYPLNKWMPTDALFLAWRIFERCVGGSRID